MSIRPLSPKKWVIDYYPLGYKGKRIRCVFEGNEDDARLYEMELRRLPSNSPRVNPKLVHIIPEYLEWLKLHRSPETHRDLAGTLKWLLPHFGNYQVPRITEGIITEYKKQRLIREDGTRRSPRTINKELNYLKSIINFMVRKKYAHPLPFKIEMLPYQRPIPQIPHPSDIEKFLSQIKDLRKKALVLFWWQIGLRYNDAAKIRWENIDWNSNTVKITQKGGRQRLCIMTQDISALLLPFKEEKGYVFENPKTGLPYKSLKRMIKTACKNAGIRHINPHLLRHAFGTYTLEATGDLRLVQELMGHKDIQSTQLYTQIAMRRFRKALDSTADYISHMKDTQKGMDN